MAADPATRYPHAFVHLDGHGRKEVIVYVDGRDWCGTGGCNTSVLAPQGPSYRVVSSITITRPPIRVLAARSHGWHNIAVWVAGGGIRPGYEAELTFSGKTYALNPSVAPARRLALKGSGTGGATGQRRRPAPLPITQRDPPNTYNSTPPTTPIFGSAIRGMSW